MQTQTATRTSSALWITIAASFGFVVVQLDVTIVNVALPEMGKRLSTGVAGLQWIVDAYTLIFAVLLISAGVLGDRFGSRRAYLQGFFVFIAASLACGLAPNAGFLIGARAVQGIGAALLVPSSLAVLNQASGHDNALRARMVALWTAAGGVSIAAGPIVGGILLKSIGWRSIFLVNLPIGALGIALTLYCVPRDSERKSIRKLDMPGQLLAIVALTGLTGGVIEAGHRGLRDPLILGAFAIAVISAFALVRVEARVPDPMLPLRFFHLPNFSPAVLFGVLVNLTYYGVVFVLSLYLQQARGYSALRTGIAYLPLTATFIVSNVISGAASARFGPRRPMVVGSLIGMAGFLLLVPLGQSTSFLGMLFPFTLIPFGMGLAVPAMTFVILASVEHAEAGTASGVLNTARQAGGAIGVALFGALVGNDRSRIIYGLHGSSLISAALLLTAAALAWFGIQKAGAHRRDA